MENILLDTNVLSELMRPFPEIRVLDWFARQTASRFSISAITKAEILLGVMLLPEGKRRDALATAAQQMFEEDFSGYCLPFDEDAAEGYSVIVSGRRQAGLAMTTEDAQIAAIALRFRIPLATRNIKDFKQIEGLVLINPWDE